MSSRAAVVGGSVVAFASGFTPQEQDDIMNSVSLAQLKASEAFDRLQQPRDWFDDFTYFLTTWGWVFDETLPEVRHRNYYSSLEEAALHHLVSIQSSSLVALIKRSIQALKLDDFSQRIFESYSGSGKLSYFQFVPCEHRDEKGSYMYVSTMHVTTLSSTKRLFFKTRISADALTLQLGWAGFYLKHQDYAQHRERVVQDLRNMRSDYITNLKI